MRGRAWLAQEAEERGCRGSHLTKHLIGFRRDRREAAFLFALVLQRISLLLARCVIGRVAAIRPHLEHKPTWRGHRECAAAILVTPRACRQRPAQQLRQLGECWRRAGPRRSSAVSPPLAVPAPPRNRRKRAAVRWRRATRHASGFVDRRRETALCHLMLHQHCPPVVPRRRADPRIATNPTANAYNAYLSSIQRGPAWLRLTEASKQMR